ncbi:glutathione S-transferase family protein [Nitrogeniibacter mangrovi]|uniref:Glutathione S-transferase family protein n=1 Tax=Nitrogeniibacter mangrovi TaxID=2016596 RepID=A0A6C1AZ59_9RHOO|nr:glutathione S-transferase family protein [Nitrogeniibacter mangrovi]QID16627.1 glutathione S-transferase family protein [Nitrogeniibacter mangrovi]
MKLIGMLDSPFVRRTLVSAHLMNLSLDNEQISVFRQADDFRALNPLVKAPTLVFDDGTVMVESQIIVSYLETLAAPSKRLTPTDPEARLRCMRLTSVALAACDKAVQLYYETRLRPEAARWPEWIARKSDQLRAAFDLLEPEVPDAGWLSATRDPNLADVSIAVAWRFARHAVPELIDAERCPRITRHSAEAEALPAFQAADF